MFFMVFGQHFTFVAGILQQRVDIFRLVTILAKKLGMDAKRKINPAILKQFAGTFQNMKFCPLNIDLDQNILVWNISMAKQSIQRIRWDLGIGTLL